MYRKEIQEHKDLLIEEAYALRKLANAFDLTGNEIMSEALFLAANNVEQSATKMLKFFDKGIGEEFDATISQMGKTLKACADA